MSGTSGRARGPATIISHSVRVSVPASVCAVSGGARGGAGACQAFPSGGGAWPELAGNEPPVTEIPRAGGSGGRYRTVSVCTEDCVERASACGLKKCGGLGSCSRSGGDALLCAWAALLAMEASVLRAVARGAGRAVAGTSCVARCGKAEGAAGAPSRPGGGPFFAFGAASELRLLGSTPRRT